MANLIAAATGNWTAAATWANAEAGASAAQLTRSESTSVTGTTYTWSSAFTCTNADVLDGVLLHLKRNGTTGTVTVALSDDGGVTDTRSVTVNASDIPADPCWMFFKFGTTLTADGGADYKVGVKCSASGSGATVYRDATAGNWARLVRTTTAPAGAPAAGDNLFVAGEWTAAATTTALTVTMDSTDSTDHGTVDIGQGGTVTFGVTASTNYVLKLSGDLNIWSGGTLNLGTVATPMPSTSTGKVLLDCASNVQYGLLVQNGGTFVAQGASKVVKTFLAADAAANATSLTVADAVTWADNDEIAIASTTRTAAQSEKGALNGAVTGGTSLTVDGFGGTGGGVAYAHSGTAPTRAELINLTRNVKVAGASASLQSYVNVAAGATCDFDYAEFYWLGSGTEGKQGVYVATTTAGNFNMQYSSIHDGMVAGSRAVHATGTSLTNFTLSNNVMFDLQNVGVAIPATTLTYTVSNNTVIYVRGYDAFLIESTVGTISGNTAVGAGRCGFYLLGTIAATMTFADNTVHSAASYGVSVAAVNSSAPVVFSNLTIWRCDSLGLVLPTVYDFTLDTALIFGNVTGGIWVNGNSSGLKIKSATLAGDSTFSTSYGIWVGNFSNLTCDNCSLGVVAGIYRAHTTCDVILGATAVLQHLFRNSTLASATPIGNYNTWATIDSYIRYQRYNGTAGDHRTTLYYGTIKTDSAIYKTAAPSERITPSSATVKVESGRARKVVDNGATATFSVWVRKSQAADAGGADYNGNQPRLILKANPAAGIASDVVLDTMTVAVGTWEQLTGTSAAVTDDAVLEAVVDSDATAGWINTDDWS